jgi:hypothetical protein
MLGLGKICIGRTQTTRMTSISQYQTHETLIENLRLGKRSIDRTEKHNDMQRKQVQVQI